MIAPLQPFAIRGVIWYQGESNANKAKEYRRLFPAMIGNWRQAWGEGNFPFLFVQIAPFRGMNPEIREAQLLSYERTTNTAMVVTVDVGDANVIHPTQKKPVGHRLALAAYALAYGQRNEYMGPIYQSMTINENKVVLHFSHVDGGLEAKGGALRGFMLAGPDHKFMEAKATINGDTVVVSSEQVSKPVAACYGWANVPDINLYNKDGLPASPFRTDPE